MLMFERQPKRSATDLSAPNPSGRSGGSSCQEDWPSQRTHEGSVVMTDEVALDELGPVDYLVVEFPAGASNFTGEMAKELVALVDAGTIRVIDVLILTKNEDGSVDAMELSDVPELGELQALEAQLAELLAEDDVRSRRCDGAGQHRGSADLGEPVGCSVRSRSRRSGGQLIANGRIPIQAIIASIEADEASTTEGA